MTERIITDEELARDGWEMIPESDPDTEAINDGLSETLEREGYGELKNAQRSMTEYLDYVNESYNRKSILTGFEPLDDLLGGGLREGLYIVSAVPSLGKTTFLLQIADQLATCGQDVIFFTLEQNKIELMGKSVSRYTKIIADEKPAEYGGCASSYLEIIDKKYRYKFNCTAEKERLIHEAENRYFKEVSKNLFYFQRPDSGIIRVTEPEMVLTKHKVIDQTTGREYYTTEEMPGDNAGISQYIQYWLEYANPLPSGNRPDFSGKLSEETRKMIKRKPVVIIDYLQIIDPPEVSRDTDKQNVDRIVTKLKQISRKFGIPIIAISSQNRASYTNEVEMSSGKESGSLEYSADVLIGLQYGDPVNYSESAEKVNKAIATVKENSRKGNPIHVTAKILKNRAGTVGNIDFILSQRYSYYSKPKLIIPKE